MSTWVGRPDGPVPQVKGVRNWLRLIVRGLGLTLGTILLVTSYFIAWGIDMLRGKGRVLRYKVVLLWGQLGIWACGLRLRIHGTPMQHGGAFVGNHTAWCDIFVLHGAAPLVFVAKAEVRGWPVIGAIAAMAGTMFVARDRKAAKAQEVELLARIKRGERMMFFPEATSTDGLRVLPFKSTLFAAFTSPAVIDEMWIQPVSTIYHPAPDQPRDFYGWWGGMSFGGHLMAVLGLSRGGVAEVVFHPPIRARDVANRKILAQRADHAVRTGHQARLPRP